MKLHTELESKCLALAGVKPPPIAEVVDEEDFQAAIIKEAKRHGWKHYHARNSRKSVAGFPDLVLVRGNRVIFAELKAEDGRLDAEQLTWAELLKEVGGNVEYYVWQPRDWSNVLEVLTRTN